MRPLSVLEFAVVLTMGAMGCTSSSTSGDADAGSGTGEQCVTIDAGSSCMGESITFCSTQAPGASMCTSAHYRVGSQTIPCQSCSSTDLEACGEQATMACLSDGGTGGDATAD